MAPASYKPQCIFTLTKGDNKGNICKNDAKKDSDLCSRHHKAVNNPKAAKENLYPTWAGLQFKEREDMSLTYGECMKANAGVWDTVKDDEELLTKLRALKTDTVNPDVACEWVNTRGDPCGKPILDGEDCCKAHLGKVHCSAQTKKGHQCKLTVKNNGLCSMHLKCAEKAAVKAIEAEAIEAEQEDEFPTPMVEQTRLITVAV